MEEVIGFESLLDILTRETFHQQSLRTYLVDETFAALKVIRIFLGVTDADLRVRYPRDFFDNALLVRGDGVHKVDEMTPGYAAFVGGDLVECGDFEAYPFYDRGPAYEIFPNGFEYSVILPVPTIGVLYLFCSTAIELNSYEKKQMANVGKILSMALREYESIKLTRLENDRSISTLTKVPLTSRQWSIKELMLKGFTNGAIAKEMNFSESLIRHETIRIYSKLGISGRKELIKREQTQG